VLIKSADDRQGDIDALTALVVRPDIDAETRRRVDQEIRSIRAGIAGERDAAYHFGFHERMRNRAVIHDLRIEVDGRVAQIDHLLISRLLDVWVCESKHFADGVGVNEHGEWVTFWGGRAHGIPSPVEQNRRHIAVLGDVFTKGYVRLPKRLGLTLKPQFRSLILVSSGARISRPKGRAAALVDGLETVVKVDQFATTIDRKTDDMSALGVVGALARHISSEDLEDLAKQLASLHRPAHTDWAAKFGLGSIPVVPSLPMAQTPEPPVATPTQLEVGRDCASCGSIVSPKVAAYCEANPQRLGGQILCWNCQRRRPKQQPGG
jgi:hypothetical protein